MQRSDESGRPHSASPLGGDFDQLPYPSMPFAYTQPAHLAALAALYGLEPPRAASARVLELGCASGGNIIPLAARALSWHRPLAPVFPRGVLATQSLCVK